LGGKPWKKKKKHAKSVFCMLANYKQISFYLEFFPGFNEIIFITLR